MFLEHEQSIKVERTKLVIFQWYVIECRPKKGHQKYMCLKEVNYVLQIVSHSRHTTIDVNWGSLM